MAEEEKKGFGDAVERAAKQLKLEKLMHQLGIKNCGCQKRKHWLNKVFPKK